MAVDVVSDPAETRGFLGENFDPEAGLQYLNARYYDPEAGLFLQSDWLDPTEPGVGTNRYAYCSNDPIGCYDPNGNQGNVEQGINEVYLALEEVFERVTAKETYTWDRFNKALNAAIPGADASGRTWDALIEGNVVAGGRASVEMVVEVALAVVGRGALPQTSRKMMGHNSSSVTGTVWDDISATAKALPNPEIPATFMLKSSGNMFYVNSNPTKHMANYLQRSANQINDQHLLASFAGAIGKVASSGTIKHRQKYNVNGWEIMFNQRANDQLPVIYYALYRP